MLRLQVCSPVYLMAYLLPSESFLVSYFPHLTTCLWLSGTIYTRKTYGIFGINIGVDRHQTGTRQENEPEFWTTEGSQTVILA